MSEYVVDFGDDAKSAVRIAMAKQHGAVVRGEIVRCRDCYFADEIEGGYWCDRFDCGKEHVTPNGFCAWGKQKEVTR